LKSAAQDRGTRRVYIHFSAIALGPDPHYELNLRVARRRTELRVARTTAVVVGVFVICWIPFSTIYVLQAYSLCLMPDCITNTMYVIAFWLGYSNSAVNPLLYAAFSRDFRAAFRKLYCS
ncbi:hypothetical protein COOONC_18139, partial [Cooperia oncophora]